MTKNNGYILQREIRDLHMFSFFHRPQSDTHEVPDVLRTFYLDVTEQIGVIQPLNTGEISQVLVELPYLHYN